MTTTSADRTTSIESQVLPDLRRVADAIRLAIHGSTSEHMQAIYSQLRQIVQRMEKQK